MSNPKKDNITFNTTVCGVCHESFDSVRALKAHAKERHVKEFNAYKILMSSSVGSDISDSLVEKLACTEARITRSMGISRGRAREMNNLLISLHGDISHADLVRVRHRRTYIRRVSEVMSDLEATASNSGGRLIGDVSMSLAEQEAEVLTQDPALTSSEITDLLLYSNDDMTREQIQIIRSSPTYKDMVVNPSGSPSRAVINTSNSSVFVPDIEVANPNVFESPLREADTVFVEPSNRGASTSKRHVKSGEVFLFKDRTPPPIPPKSRKSKSKNNANTQLPIETIVLDDSEGAEAVEGPMDIATSPTPAGPLQADTAPVEGDRTPQRPSQSPTPQEVRTESLDLLERIRVMKRMMGDLPQGSEPTNEESTVVSSTAPNQPDPEDLKLLEDAASGVDLDSLIPELLAVVAASMTSVTTATVDPCKKERLITSFTLKHQRVLTKSNDSPLSKLTCIKIVDLFEEFVASREGLTPYIVYSYLNHLVFAKNKATPPSKNLSRKVKSLLAARYVYRLKDNMIIELMSALESGPTFNKITNILIRDSVGGFNERKSEMDAAKQQNNGNKKKGASNRGSFYSGKALQQALRKDFGKTMSAVIDGKVSSHLKNIKMPEAFLEGWAENFSTASKTDDRSPTPVGRAGRDPLGMDGGMFRSIDIPVITKLYNRILLLGELPPELLCGNTSFVPKKEEPTDMGDFSSYNSPATRNPGPAQKNSLVLNSLLKLATKNNKKRRVALAFIDFSKAFDSVSHESLLKACERSGVPPLLLKYFKFVYNKSPPPIPPKSRNFNTNNNASNQQPIKTIVLDDSEVAEAVEGPMDIVTSPTPSPTPQEVRAESFDLLKRIREMKRMMGDLPQGGDPTNEESAVVSSTAPDQPDPEDLKLLEAAASGVDLDSFIPELLAVVAASMTSGKNKTSAVSKDQPGPTVTVATVDPSKKERLIISFTLKHQRVLTKVFASREGLTPYVVYSYLNHLVFAKNKANSTIKKPTNEGEEFAGIQIRLQVKRRYDYRVDVSP
ncbi:unnamed protein product [Lepeophtheirus salmonis]|uniref:(salmon louse) hypothetical protein n=1 Tax=Lepeophtheirus salmonis TaxID=72036 RepID=A0A7R8CSN0_LEPSM|nr:unnamed protein product [Lepeophtheirus salmonis]CAF2880479.1 unnamed protein product [Lepeophtheirus salmonis]